MQTKPESHTQPLRSLVRAVARHLGRPAVVVAAMGLVCAGVLVPRGISAQEAPARIGVLSLDRQPGSVRVTGQLVDHLRSTDAVVHGRTGVRALLDGAVVDPSEQGEAPSGLTESIAKGIRQFFYQSRDDAVTTLEQAVDRALNHLPALARRPALADQVFEAGIVLVRAARITEAPASAESTSPSLAVETARRLMAAFPSRTPSAETAPPAIVELFEQARAETAARQTTLRLEIPSDDCTGLINGMTTGRSTVHVAPEMTYYVQLDCRQETSPLRSLALQEGQARVVPLFVGASLPAAPDVFSDTDPQEVERQLERTLAWSGLTTLLGVRQSGKGPSRRTTVLHLSSQDPPKSTQYEGRFRPQEFTKEVLGLDSTLDSEAVTSEATVRRDRSPGRGFDIGVLAGGAVSLAASSGLFVAAAKNHRLLRCSANATEPFPRERCRGASTQGVTLSQSDASSREAQINRQRILGVTLGAVGVAGATWGIVRLLKRPAAGTGEPAEPPRAALVVTNRSASFVFNF